MKYLSRTGFLLVRSKFVVEKDLPGIRATNPGSHGHRLNDILSRTPQGLSHLRRRIQDKRRIIAVKEPYNPLEIPPGKGSKIKQTAVPQIVRSEPLDELRASVRVVPRTVIQTNADPSQRNIARFRIMNH
jgi:hypothetical protein